MTFIREFSTDPERHHDTGFQDLKYFNSYCLLANFLNIIDFNFADVSKQLI